MTGKDLEIVAQYCHDEDNNQVNEQQLTEQLATKVEEQLSSPLTEYELVNCLDRHNHYRRLHGVNPVQLDQALTNLAQDWADYLVEKRMLIHPENNPYGENLYLISGNCGDVNEDAGN